MTNLDKLPNAGGRPHFVRDYYLLLAEVGQQYGSQAAWRRTPNTTSLKQPFLIIAEWIKYLKWKKKRNYQFEKTEFLI